MLEKHQTSTPSDSSTASEDEASRSMHSDAVTLVNSQNPLADPWQFSVYLSKLAATKSDS